MNELDDVMDLLFSFFFIFSSSVIGWQVTCTLSFGSWQQGYYEFYTPIDDAGFLRNTDFLRSIPSVLEIYEY